MKILITGGTGYIGTKLAKELVLSGHSVTIISRNKDKAKGIDFPVSIIFLDLIKDDINSLDLNCFDVIYNCAGEINNEKSMYDLHIKATMKLLQCISNTTTRWVQLSSVGVYGRNLSGEVNEDSPFSPVGKYEVTKAEAEIKVKEYCLKNGIPFSILRPSNVFSVDMPNKSLRQLVKVVERGLFFYMKDPSTVMANYIHVDNVVDALVLCGFCDNAVNNDFIISDCLNQKEFISSICNELKISLPRFTMPYFLVSFFARILSFLPLGINFNAKVEALSTTVCYSTDKIERSLGFTRSLPLKLAISHFCKSI